jgi:hypothetical protein
MGGASGSWAKPGDSWKNPDGSISYVNDDGSIYTTPATPSQMQGMGVSPAGAVIANAGLSNAAARGSSGIADLAPEPDWVPKDSIPGMTQAEANNSILAGNTPEFQVPKTTLDTGADLSLPSGVPDAAPIAAQGWTGGAGTMDIAAAAYVGAKQYQGVKNVLKGNDMSLQQQAALALPTFGTSFLYNPVKNSFKSRTRGEEHQRGALIKQGINVPINESAPHGKEWELNPTFAASRNEADLGGKDIMHASDFYAMIPDYEKFTDAQKEKTAQQALNMGIVNEKLGKVNVGLKDSPEYQKWVEQMHDAALNQSSGGGGGGNYAAEAKKARKKEIALSMIDLAPKTNPGLRYDYNEIVRNPYANR